MPRKRRGQLLDAEPVVVSSLWPNCLLVVITYSYHKRVPQKVRLAATGVLVEIQPTALPDSIALLVMTCVGCAVSVRFALNGLEGVYEAEVDIKGSKAVAAYAAEKVTIAQMVQAINATGFKAHRPTSG